MQITESVVDIAIQAIDHDIERLGAARVALQRLRERLGQHELIFQSVSAADKKERQAQIEKYLAALGEEPLSASDSPSCPDRTEPSGADGPVKGSPGSKKGGRRKASGKPQEAKREKMKYTASIADVAVILQEAGQPLSEFVIREKLEAAGIKVTEDKVKEVLMRGKDKHFVKEDGRWRLFDQERDS